MKHSSLCKVIFLFLMTTAVSTPTIAGKITLHNGDVFHGELTAINKEAIVWMSDTLGELRLPKEKVEYFASSTVLHTVKSDANNAENCSLKMSETIDMKSTGRSGIRHYLLASIYFSLLCIYSIKQLVISIYSPC